MINRRTFLHVSALGLAGVVVGARELVASGAVGMTMAQTGVLQLTMRECLAEMVDLTPVYMWAFETPQTGLRIPGPVIYAEQGTEVVIEVTNALPHSHAFAVPDVVDSGPVAPGETVRIAFAAPAAGTYVYSDPTGEPISRAMGLAGALVVTAASGPTPYSEPTRAVANLFDDLGTNDHFPGDPWRPVRTWNWVFSSVDHVLHERVRNTSEVSPAEFAAAYHPTYFMINGKSGYFAGADPATQIHGRVGQPALIRSVNVGLAVHSPHTHGNHVYVLAVDAKVQSNAIAHDTWELSPMSTTDVLLPFVRPPDAYPWPPTDPSVWTTDLGGDGHAGMVFPMHCHAELSQLADGSNYPQGAVTHWVLTGDLESPPGSTTTSSSTTTTSTPTTTSTSTTSTSTSTSTTTSTSTATTSTSTSTSTPTTSVPGRPKVPREAAEGAAPAGRTRVARALELEAIMSEHVHDHDHNHGGIEPVVDTTTGELPVIRRDSIDRQTRLEAFSCDVRADSPPTPDRVDPDVHFILGVHDGARVRMPDGERVEFMSFHHWIPDDEDDDDTKIFPAPLLRVSEGQIVHTTLRPSSNTHTIHHHGIEPTAHNDGVGHASFEVSDEYTYQWRPSSAGTYFYHCHKNTVLHFELGMYGPLIVDPPGGAGFVRSGMDTVPYDREVLWIPDDVDPAWHLIEDHHEGIRTCPFDPSEAMRYFEPKYWLLSGIPHPQTRTHTDVALNCQVGERVLVRLLNAAYGPVNVTLPFATECVGVDGHALGGPHDRRYSYPYDIPADSTIQMTTAQRYDLLITPDRAGVFDVTFRFKDWIRGDVYGLAETTITVT